MRPSLLLRIFLLICLLAGFHPSFATEDFLDPKEAFVPKVKVFDAQTLDVSFAIAQGYYLYRDKFKFIVDSGALLGMPIFPEGKEKNDENFGKVEVYTNQVSIRLPLERTASGPLILDLQLTSQGCADGGLCYPPQHQRFQLELPAAPMQAPSAAPSTPQVVPNASSPDESSRVTLSLRKNGFWTNIALFFIAGLGLALTPCVFPMIPILSGIIAGQGSRLSHARALALSIMYVLGMATTYAIAGVIAGLTGNLISSLMQNPWVLSAFALIFVLLAFSMFGFFQLQLPATLQSKLSEEAGHFANGRGAGVFIMGGLSALIVGPCVLPFLAGALIYIGQTGNAFLGGASLFAMALGQGIPLIIVGLSTGALLPHAGAWMGSVSRAFGIILLGIALWLVSPLLPAGVVMGGWAALFIIPAVFLHALDPLPATAKGGQRLMKGVGLILLLTGTALLAGALSGSRNPWQPLDGLFGNKESIVSSLPFERMTTLPELKSRLEKAEKPVMLNFTADWCSDCRRMEREVFSSAEIRTKLARFTLLKVDITANSEEDRLLLANFGIYGPPALLFFNTGGKEINEARLIGVQDVAALSKALDRLSPIPISPNRD